MKLPLCSQLQLCIHGQGATGHCISSELMICSPPLYTPDVSSTKTSLSPVLTHHHLASLLWEAEGRLKMRKTHSLVTFTRRPTVLFRLIFNSHQHFPLERTQWEQHVSWLEGCFCVQRATSKPRTTAKGLQGTGTLHPCVGVCPDGQGAGLVSGSTVKLLKAFCPLHCTLIP